MLQDIIDLGELLDVLILNLLALIFHGNLCVLLRHRLVLDLGCFLLGYGLGLLAEDKKLIVDVQLNIPGRMQPSV